MPLNYTATEAVDAIAALIRQTHAIRFTGVPSRLEYSGPELTHCSVLATQPTIRDSLTRADITGAESGPLAYLVLKAYQLGYNACAERRDVDDRIFGRDERIDAALADLERKLDLRAANS